jgi:pimeloyl-ACP methyl ester carboxylesterase
MTTRNSTNVHSKIEVQAVRWLAAVSPRAAASTVANLFLETPKRRAPREAEQQLFAGAEPLNFNFDGERLAGWRFGHGPAVLLLHGWGGSSFQMHAFIPALLARGLSVVAFDAPGHGQSSGHWLAIPRYARAILRAQQQLGPFHGLIAHSMGGAAAARAIGLGLPVQRAVFIGPPASEYEFFSQWAQPFELSEHALRLTKLKVEERVGLSFEALRAPAIAPEIARPLLVIHDREDREVPWDDGAAIAAAAPDARLQTTRGLGHRRILRDPEVVNSSIEFLLEQRPHTRSATHAA